MAFIKISSFTNPTAWEQTVSSKSEIHDHHVSEGTFQRLTFSSILRNQSPCLLDYKTLGRSLGANKLSSPRFKLACHLLGAVQGIAPWVKFRGFSRGSQ